MTKTGFIKYAKDFVNANAEEGAKPITNKEARAMVDSVFGALVEALSSGHEICIPGVVKFGLKTVSERSGVSALTGKSFVSPEHLRCTVKFSKAVREAIAVATLAVDEEADETEN